MMDVVICTKDPPESFELTLQCLKRQKGVQRLLVIATCLTPRLQQLQTQYEFSIIEEPVPHCLAWARKLGIQAAKTNFLAFVDEDVFLGKDHLWQLYQVVKNCPTPIAIEGILQPCYLKQSLTNTPAAYKPRILKLGERGFTHNTILKREAIQDWNPPFIFSWEDWHLTQYILKRGGFWIRYPQATISYHLKDHRLQSAKWGGAGERFLNQHSLMGALARGGSKLLAGVKNMITRKDVKFLIAESMNAYGGLVGYLRAEKYRERSSKI